MKKQILFVLLLIGLLPWFGCSSLNKKESSFDGERVEIALRTMQTIQTKYAPDSRFNIFHITPEEQGDYLILKGEVDSPEAKDELLTAFRQLGIKAVDRITVLPSPDLGESIWGIIRISVANMREKSSPGAELGTQVVMGNVVKVWKREGPWYYVQSSDRYLGYMEDDVVVLCTKEQLNAWNSSKRLVITAYEGRIWQEPNSASLPVSDIVAGALVKNLGERGDWYQVELPDGRTGFLAKNTAMDYEEWRNTRRATPDSIERTAKSFLGLPYLWGGTSTKAVDCSGFTKLVYAFNGVGLNRNASQQAMQGTDVPIDSELSQLKMGDLLFFGARGTPNKPEKVTHVGIYLGNKQFIHSSGMVHISSLDPKSPLLDERRLRGLLRVRRLL